MFLLNYLRFNVRKQTKVIYIFNNIFKIKNILVLGLIFLLVEFRELLEQRCNERLLINIRIFICSRLFPVDLIKTRLQNYKGNTSLNYFDLTRNVVKTEGARGLYRGRNSCLKNRSIVCRFISKFNWSRT